MSYELISSEVVLRLRDTAFSGIAKLGHTGVCYSEDTDSYTTQLPLCTFSARFAIDNGTFGTNNFQDHLDWWGTGSSC